MRKDGQEGWNVPKGMTVGTGYFDSFKKWNGPNIKFVLDVPLHGEKQPTKDSSRKFLQAGLDAIGSKLGAVEIGNEPDDYEKVPSDPHDHDWTPESYDQTWHDFAYDFRDSVKAKITSSNPFQALGLAQAPKSNDAWQLQKWFNNQHGHHFDYSMLQTVSMHYYQTSRGIGQQDNIQTELMNHGAIVDRMNAYVESIKYTTDNHLLFVMGEVGSSTNRLKDNQQYDDYDFEAVLGSALWTVDWMLYAMSLGIARVSMQQGTGFAYAAWQPQPLSDRNTPHIDDKWKHQAIAAPYYGYLFVADFIGPDPDVQMQQLTIDNNGNTGNNGNTQGNFKSRANSNAQGNGNNGNVQPFVAYGAYEHGTLQRIAIINLEQCGSPAAKCTDTTISLPVPEGKTKATLSKMTGPNDSGTMAMGKDMAYAGKNYQWERNGEAGDTTLANTQTSVTAESGFMTFLVRQSEAVLVTFV